MTTPRQFWRSARGDCTRTHSRVPVQRLRNDENTVLLVALLFWFVATSAHAGQSLLHFKSTAGDYIGQGQDVTLTPVDADFTAQRNFDNGVSLSINNFGPPIPASLIFWNADFAAPFDEPLMLGAYETATRYPFQAPSEPGLSFHGNGRGCNTLTGRFEVLEVTFDLATDAVVSFAVDFEQHCEGAAPALFGSIRFNSDVPLPSGTVIITSPTTAGAYTASSPFLTLGGIAADSTGVGFVTWSTDRGGTGTAEGTTDWVARNIPLYAGTNIIRVTATSIKPASAPDRDEPSASASATATLVVTVNQFTYYLAEGATGRFFDCDLLVANPNGVVAPVTISFLKADGSQVVLATSVPADSRQTVRVNDILGLASEAFSTVVSSDAAVPLVVERSMFWDASVPGPARGEVRGLAGASYYGGHTGSSVDSPRTTWLFAEGSQDLFDTYLLLANANAEATAVTVTYLVEGAGTIVQQVNIPPASRLTLWAGAIPALFGRSFGIKMTSTLPIIAERAMYFRAGRFWEGGHESAGVPEPATSWFLAEGATGAFFDTFILVGNPNGVPAHLAVTYLLASGGTLAKAYVVPANGRTTINVETEDAELADTAVSTTVTTEVPVVVERAMYWAGGSATWYEAHNSFGVTSTGTKWGLAEGRVGTSLGYETFILLANAGATAAQVRITYLRTSGPPVVKTYAVAPTSRLNVWVNVEVPELIDEGFGSLIEVTNDVQIAVERALYWDSSGQTWGGGTNATAVRLP